MRPLGRSELYERDAMLNYRVTLQESTSREHVMRTEEVEVEDTGSPVANNGAAIAAAITRTEKIISGVSWSPVRVERI